MKQIALCFALALLLFTADVHAAGTCGVVFSSEMISIFLLGMLISVLLVSLWYMVGRLLESPDIDATMKIEMQQLGITILIAIIIAGVLQLLCSVAIYEKGIALGERGGMVAAVDRQLYSTLKETLKAYLDMTQKIQDYAMVGSAYGGVSIWEVSVMLSPYIAYSSVAQAISPVSQMTLLAFVSLVFQYTLLKITQSTVFLYLIPIGLSLRAFPITRKFGGVLVAVCLGMSFVYPLTVALGFALVGDFKYQHMSGLLGGPMSYIMSLSGAMLTLSVMGFTAFPFIIEMILSTIFAGATVVSAILGLGTNFGSFVREDLQSLYSSFASIMLVAFFLPILEVMVTSAIVRSLSASIGAETDISGIMRAI